MNNIGVMELPQSFIIKKFSNKRILINVIILSLGVYLIVLSRQIDLSFSWVLNPVLLTAGCIAFFAGMIRLIWGSRIKVYSKTNALVIDNSIYFGVSELGKLKNAIENKNAEAFRSLKPNDSSGTMIKMSYAEDLSYVELQLFEYIPHSFEAVTDLCRFFDNDAELITKSLLISDSK